MRSAMREEIAQLKRERILEEARQLFFEKGYQGTTLDAVARQLEVTKPFIYSHFDNKAALLGEISERGTLKSLEAITHAHEADGDPAQRLAQGIREFCQVVIDHQANIATYFREEQYVPEASAARINAWRAEIDRKMAALVREGVEAGDFKVPDINIATLAIGGMVSWMFTWYRSGGRLSDEQLCDYMVQLALSMLGAAPPA
ncbi:MAG: TetR/AcrR family transcriptional regulator [Minwuia sp.]|uniref:TetR/AcrR family transcriptional regulator n=1 Tax=Minwuia sp. TaxID=2493630 RepID=UPI003A8799D0